MVADETTELPLQTGDLASLAVQLASAGTGLLESAELGDAHADLLKQLRGLTLLGK
jgi:hypothetical protein